MSGRIWRSPSRLLIDRLVQIAALHACSRRSANVVAALAAAQNPRPVGETGRFSSRSAIGAEPTSPPVGIIHHSSHQVPRDDPIPGAVADAIFPVPGSQPRM